MEDPSQVALFAWGLTEGTVQLQLLSLARAWSCRRSSTVYVGSMLAAWKHWCPRQGLDKSKGLDKQLLVGGSSKGGGFNLHQRDGFAQGMARRTPYPTRSLLTVRNKPC